MDRPLSHAVLSDPVTTVSEYQVQSDCSQTLYHKIVKKYCFRQKTKAQLNNCGFFSFYEAYFKNSNFLLVASFIKHCFFYIEVCRHVIYNSCHDYYLWFNCHQTNYFLNLYFDRVHVVFGLVISGFEVIEQIENLKTDAASRPYADVRVIDCGVLATKSTKDGKSFCRVVEAWIQVKHVEDYNLKIPSGF